MCIFISRFLASESSFAVKRSDSVTNSRSLYLICCTVQCIISPARIRKTLPVYTARRACPMTIALIVEATLHLYSQYNAEMVPFQLMCSTFVTLISLLILLFFARARSFMAPVRRERERVEWKRKRERDTISLACPSGKV